MVECQLELQHIQSEVNVLFQQEESKNSAAVQTLEYQLNTVMTQLKEREQEVGKLRHSYKKKKNDYSFVESDKKVSHTHNTPLRILSKKSKTGTTRSRSWRETGTSNTRSTSISNYHCSGESMTSPTRSNWNAKRNSTSHDRMLEIIIII